jgi:AcrR family transcriptional regulator
MSSVTEDGDLTARATIRNAALRLFADKGHDAVTMREIAAAAGVSPALVVHHFGSKDGLLAAVDEFAGRAFDSLFELDADQLVAIMAGEAAPSIAELFASSFPPGSPLPAYLRRLLLTNDPAGAALFGRWYAATKGMLASMSERDALTPSDDPDFRAAFLLANDLAVVVLRTQIAAAVGVDPLSPQGMARWAREAHRTYTEGAFRAHTADEPATADGPRTAEEPS